MLLDPRGIRCNLHNPFESAAACDSRAIFRKLRQAADLRNRCKKTKDNTRGRFQLISQKSRDPLVWDDIGAAGSRHPGRTARLRLVQVKTPLRRSPPDTYSAYRYPIAIHIEATYLTRRRGPLVMIEKSGCTRHDFPIYGSSGCVIGEIARSAADRVAHPQHDPQEARAHIACAAWTRMGMLAAGPPGAP
jgi:hypothetical protein